MPRKKSKAAPRTAAPKATALSIVILAAGQGKRMQSDIPKVLQPLAGVPMLAHVLQVARSLEPASIHVVRGHGGERVRELFDDGKLQWALQAEQLGTGDALQQALPQIPDSHQVLVLYGDVPLLRADTLRGLLSQSDARMAACCAMRAASCGASSRKAMPLRNSG
jgi:bifunctional UDP-N-acetylglucosamine pyrophosphorylase/glucosamine-1-phosphate N-acetyltransferase